MGCRSANPTARPGSSAPSTSIPGPTGASGRCPMKRSDPETLQAWRARSKPLTRTNGLRRTKELTRSPIKPANPARRRKMHRRNFGDRAEHIRAMSCLVNDGCSGRVVAAHVTARGMGGCNSSRSSLVPLCWDHHEEQHRIGVPAFARHYALDLERWAEEIASRLDALGID